MNTNNLNTQATTTEDARAKALAAAQAMMTETRYTPLQAGHYDMLITDLSVKVDSTNVIYLNVTGTINDKPVTFRQYVRPKYNEMKVFLDSLYLQLNIDGMSIAELLQDSALSTPVKVTKQHVLKEDKTYTNWKPGHVQINKELEATITL